MTNTNGAPQLLINRAADGQPWLGLRLVLPAGRGVRDALGARAEVRMPAVEGRPAVSWTRWAGTGGSYASAGDPRLIFGLGGEEGPPPERVEVRVSWPGGAEEVFRGVPTGRYSTLRRGDGLAQDVPDPARAEP